MSSTLTQFLIHRFGREHFSEAAKISKRLEMDRIDWKKFKYMVFDVPNQTGTYEERYHVLGWFPLPPFQRDSLF